VDLVEFVHVFHALEDLLDGGLDQSLHLLLPLGQHLERILFALLHDELDVLSVLDVVLETGDVGVLQSVHGLHLGVHLRDLLLVAQTLFGNDFHCDRLVVLGLG